ncbi:MAG: class I SAM-dependent methyltransferase [Candidatus Curtissbacteria bacterium]|nr:class I SAM-dependent methyltransferase [Candidatus Curtissbacteria bacterium]
MGKTEEVKFREAVRKYWEDPSTISIIDKNLHKLEIETVCRYLKSTDELVDIGCGDGEATAVYSQKVKKCTGYELSSFLRKKAAETIKRSGLKNTTIKAGDILKMKKIPEKPDVVVTQRLLINLASWNEQKEAIENIYRMLKPGGLYIMIENTNDAYLALNDMRHQVGLQAIPIHWHNLFFDYDELMSFIKDKFQLLNFHDFGLYYFLTRIYAPMFLSFSGFGKNAKKDPLFDLSDKAAMDVYNKFKDRFQINGSRALGPIQVFVLKKLN